MDTLLNPQQEKYQKQRYEKALKRIDIFAEQKEKGLFLYILKCDIYYKIGIASNIKSRLNSLQCGNPFDIDLLYKKRIKDARELEKNLHNGLISLKHKREWFILEDDFVKDLIEFIENYE